MIGTFRLSLRHLLQAVGLGPRGVVGTAPVIENIDLYNIYFCVEELLRDSCGTSGTRPFMLLR